MKITSLAPPSIRPYVTRREAAMVYVVPPVVVSVLTFVVSWLWIRSFWILAVVLPVSFIVGNIAIRLLLRRIRPRMHHERLP